MGHRSRRRPRCFGCGLTPRTCVCGLLPRVQFRTPIAIVQHVREEVKPTNTGRLLARMVEGTALLSYGGKGRTFDPAPLRDPSIQWRLLFPRQGAPVLDPADRPAADRRFGFVVLDGTWTQCARMSRRVPGVSGLPCVSLPAGPPSFWTVRTQRDPGGLSTCEAALRAIELLEGSSSVAPVRRAFAWVTAQVLRQKGKPEPPGWPLEKDPRLETFLEGIPGSSGPRLLPCPREFGGEQGPGNWGDPADVKGADPDPRGSDGHRKDL